MRAEAIAIQGSHVLAVGSDTEIAAWISPATKKIDAQGKSVLPGFIDAQSHAWPVRRRHARHSRRENPNGWFPEQKLTLQEAIEAYTMGSAYAEFREKEKGSLAPGKLTDVVILDTDLFSIAPEKIKDAAVRYTIVGGAIVYEAAKD